MAAIHLPPSAELRAPGRRPWLTPLADARFGPDLCSYDVSRIHLIFNKAGENLLKTDEIKLEYDDKNEFTHLYTLASPSSFRHPPPPVHAAPSSTRGLTSAPVRAAAVGQRGDG